MGVPKLWEELEAGHCTTSWSQLVEPAFQRPGTRSLRVGVDTPLWLFHMGRMHNIVDPETGLPQNVGANADVRMVFFRACDFLRRGILPVFVFDGPKRPSFKRDRNVGGHYRGRSELELTRLFGLMGFEVRKAPAEAEAELAAMQERGEIDAVLTDDVDTLLFGKPTLRIIRNPSKTLSANHSKKYLERQASTPAASQPGPSQSQPSQSAEYMRVPPSHDKAVTTYSAADIAIEAGLDRNGMILIALMSGADYDTKGSFRVGITISAALARAGYGASLVEGVKRIRSSPAARDFPASAKAALDSFLTEWRESVANELRTNANKLFSKRHLKVADELEADSSFPRIDILDFYLSPVVSDPTSSSYVAPTWSRDVDIEGLASYMISKFEWSHVEVLARFRDLLWLGLAVQHIRRAALAEDASLPLTRVLPAGFIALVESRKCAESTDFVPSYRVELDPSVFNLHIAAALPGDDPFEIPDYTQLSQEQVAAVKAVRKAEGRAQEPPASPRGATVFRHWVPVEVLESCEEGREAVQAWKDLTGRKKRAKEDEELRKEERRRAREAGYSSPEKKGSPLKKLAFADSRRTTARRRPTKTVMPPDDSSDSDKDVHEIVSQEKARNMREAMLVEARTGKGKAREEPIAALTSSRSQRSLSNPAAQQGLLSFASTKRGILSHSTKATSVSPLVANDSDSDVFLHSHPKTSPKRPVPSPPPDGRDTLSPPTSEPSDDDLYRSKHVPKATRMSSAKTSPSKTRRAKPPPTILELSSDSSPERVKEKASPQKKKQGAKQDEGESLTAWLRRRTAEKAAAEERRTANVITLSDSD
ncbi:DNA repair endonuclease rad2 [Rhodotorula toruloides]|uniref:DNA repair endonuclease rad2 n=1 Tax=Rhodotorula toruloides TaxID=5286 RepID=A0A511KFP4_RHOTO|nr:DNA repair endonuclease rad2 [Rhodotorula toruloides]